MGQERRPFAFLQHGMFHFGIVRITVTIISGVLTSLPSTLQISPSKLRHAHTKRTSMAHNQAESVALDSPVSPVIGYVYQIAGYLRTLHRIMFILKLRRDAIGRHAREASKLRRRNQPFFLGRTGKNKRKHSFRCQKKQRECRNPNTPPLQTLILSETRAKTTTQTLRRRAQ